MSVGFSRGNRLTGDKLFEQQAIDLCKILEKGGEKITDSALALSKKSLLKH